MFWQKFYKLFRSAENKYSGLEKNYSGIARFYLCICAGSLQMALLSEKITHTFVLGSVRVLCNLRANYGGTFMKDITKMTDEESSAYFADLDRKIDETNEKIEYCRKKRAQLEHQISTIETRIRNDAEKKRTHRLIVRGAILESLIPDAEMRSDDEIKHLLISMIGALPDKLRESLFEKRSD